MPGGDFREDKQSTSSPSTQSTPGATPSATPTVTPQASPGPNRSKFDAGNVTTGMGGTEGRGSDWSLFGTRAAVSKSSTDPESLSLQSCPGSQKAPAPLEVKTTWVSQELPVALKPAKIEVPGLEAKKNLHRPHKLKPRDLNVLTPSGF